LFSSRQSNEVSSVDEFPQSLEMDALDGMCEASATFCKKLEDEAMQAEFNEKQPNVAGTRTTAYRSEEVKPVLKATLENQVGTAQEALARKENSSTSQSQQRPPEQPSPLSSKPPSSRNPTFKVERLGARKETHRRIARIGIPYHRDNRGSGNQETARAHPVAQS
jgi:hypothetical protein